MLNSTYSVILVFYSEVALALSSDVTLSISKYILTSIHLSMDTIIGMADSARDRITRNLFHVLYLYCLRSSQLRLWYMNLSLQTQVYKKNLFSKYVSSLQGDISRTEGAAGEQDNGLDFCTCFLLPWCSPHSCSHLTFICWSTNSALFSCSWLGGLFTPSGCPYISQLVLCSQACTTHPPCPAPLWLAENSTRPNDSNILWRYTVNKTRSDSKTCWGKYGKQLFFFIISIWVRWGSYFRRDGQGWFLGTGVSWAEVAPAMSIIGS